MTTSGPSNSDDTSDSAQADNDNEWIVKDTWTAGDDRANTFTENNELTRPGIQSSERIRMLEKRFGKPDAPPIEDRKVVHYGDLDSPLDENIDTNSRRSRHNPNNKTNKGNLIRTPAACGKLISRKPNQSD